MFAATYARLMRRPSCGGVFVVDREKYLHWEEITNVLSVGDRKMPNVSGE